MRSQTRSVPWIASSVAIVVVVAIAAIVLRSDRGALERGQNDRLGTGRAKSAVSPPAHAAVPVDAAQRVLDAALATRALDATTTPAFLPTHPWVECQLVDVASTDRASIAGARIVLEQDSGPARHELDEARTDSDGLCHFDLKREPIGPLLLRAIDPLLSKPAIAEVCRRVTLSAERGQRLRVRTQRDGLGLAATVVARLVDTPDGSESFCFQDSSDADGRLEQIVARRGTLRLRAIASDAVSPWIDTDLEVNREADPAKELEELSIELPPATTNPAAVVSVTGDPIAGADVVLAGVKISSAPTGDDGRTSILAAGAFTAAEVAIRKCGQSLRPERVERLADGGVRLVVPKIAATLGAVLLDVRTPDDRPIAGAWIGRDGALGHGAFDVARTDASGRATVRALGDPNWDTVLVYCPGFEAQAVAVVPGEMRVVMAPRDPVQIRVVTAAGEAIAHALVIAERRCGKQSLAARFTCDENGATQVGAGEGFEVFAISPGADGLSERLPIEAGTRSLELHAPAPRARWLGCKAVDEAGAEVASNVRYVIDGSAGLHRESAASPRFRECANWGALVTIHATGDDGALSGSYVGALADPVVVRMKRDLIVRLALRAADEPLRCSVRRSGAAVWRFAAARRSDATVSVALPEWGPWDVRLRVGESVGEVDGVESSSAKDATSIEMVLAKAATLRVRSGLKVALRSASALLRRRSPSATTSDDSCEWNPTVERPEFDSEGDLVLRGLDPGRCDVVFFVEEDGGARWLVAARDVDVEPDREASAEGWTTPLQLVTLRAAKVDAESSGVLKLEPTGTAAWLAEAEWLRAEPTAEGWAALLWPGEFIAQASDGSRFRVRITKSSAAASLEKER